MATSTTYNKQQIVEMIRNNNPLIEFRKPKHTKKSKMGELFTGFC